MRRASQQMCSLTCLCVVLMILSGCNNHREEAERLKVQLTNATNQIGQLTGTLSQLSNSISEIKGQIQDKDTQIKQLKDRLQIEAEKALQASQLAEAGRKERLAENRRKDWARLNRALFIAKDLFRQLDEPPRFTRANTGYSSWTDAYDDYSEKHWSSKRDGVEEQLTMASTDEAKSSDVASLIRALVNDLKSFKSARRGLYNEGMIEGDDYDRRRYDSAKKSVDSKIQTIQQNLESLKGEWGI